MSAEHIPHRPDERRESDTPPPENTVKQSPELTTAAAELFDQLQQIFNENSASPQEREDAA